MVLRATSWGLLSIISLPRWIVHLQDKNPYFWFSLFSSLSCKANLHLKMRAYLYGTWIPFCVREIIPCALYGADSLLCAPQNVHTIQVPKWFPGKITQVSTKFAQKWRGSAAVRRVVPTVFCLFILASVKDRQFENKLLARKYNVKTVTRTEPRQTTHSSDHEVSVICLYAACAHIKNVTVAHTKQGLCHEW